MIDIIVNEELRDLLPPLAEEEFEQLEANILENGIRDPLLLWNNTIVDGHNRYQIAQKHNLDFDTKNIELDGLREAKLYILKNQIGRRNLTPFQRVEYAKKIADLLGDAPNQARRLGQGERPFDERKHLSELSGVSEGNISRIEYVKKQAPSALVEALEKNEISVNAAYEFTKTWPEAWVERLEAGEVSGQEAVEGYRQEKKEEKQVWEGQTKTPPSIPKVPSNFRGERRGGLSASDLFAEEEEAEEEEGFGELDLDELDLSAPLEEDEEDFGELPSFLSSSADAVSDIEKRTSVIKSLMGVDLVDLGQADEGYVRDYYHYYGQGLSYAEVADHLKALGEEVDRLHGLVESIIQEEENNE